MASVNSANNVSNKPAYFEFLLKPSLLEEHIQQADPGKYGLIYKNLIMYSYCIASHVNQPAR